MDVLMVTGVSSHDIFIYNFAKWLKTAIDVNIDIYELSNSNIQKNEDTYYRHIGSPHVQSIFEKKYIRSIFKPIILSKQLKEFLNNKNYDIIHCHWMVPSIIINNCLRKHCRRLYVTFWGGELESLKLLGSHKIYLKFLVRFMRNVDCVVNSQEFKPMFNAYIPQYKGQYKFAQFGSEPIGRLCELMEYETREVSKFLLGIPRNLTTVQIGYSGKQLHQHLEIINELGKADDNIKKKIFILSPMTRNYNDEYVLKVEAALEKSGIPFLVLKGYLSDFEIARLRNATDVVFQYSLFDGFSRSIVEGMCAKSLLIYGNWLKYDQYLERWGLFSIKTDGIANGVTQLKKYLKNTVEYKEYLENNSNHVRDLFLWKTCIKDWVDAYCS